MSFWEHIIKYVQSVQIFNFYYSKITRIYTECHNEDNSWNDRWQLEGLYLEELHQQRLLFLVFSFALKNKKISQLS